MHRYNNLLHQCKANEKCGKLYGLFVAPAFFSSFNAAKMRTIHLNFDVEGLSSDMAICGISAKLLVNRKSTVLLQGSCCCW